MEDNKMKDGVKQSAITFLLFYLSFLAVFFATHSQLPARIASHFGASGAPDGWMSRESYSSSILLLALWLPLLPAMLFYLLRWIPVRWINLPPAFLTKENAPITLNDLLRRGLWLGCLLLVFVAGIHFSVVQANLAKAPRLPNGTIIALSATFLSGLAVWAYLLIRRYFY